MDIARSEGGWQIPKFLVKLSFFVFSPEFGVMGVLEELAFNFETSFGASVSLYQFDCHNFRGLYKITSFGWDGPVYPENRCYWPS